MHCQGRRKSWNHTCGWTGLKAGFWWQTCFWENPTFRSETRFAPHLTISRRLAPFSIEFEQKKLCDLIEKKLNRFHENAHSFWLNCFHKILKIALKSSCWHWPRTTANSKLISWEQNPLLTLFTHTWCWCPAEIRYSVIKARYAPRPHGSTSTPQVLEP